MSKTNKILSADDKEVDNQVLKLMFEEFLNPPYWMQKGECVKNNLSLDALDNSKDDFINKYCSKCEVCELCNKWGSKHDIKNIVYGGKIIDNIE